MVLAKRDPAGLAPQRLAFGPAIWGWGPAGGLIVWASGLLILPWWAAVFLWWWPSILFGAALGLATIGLANRLARAMGTADGVARHPAPASRSSGSGALAASKPLRLHQTAAPAPQAPEPALKIMHVITRLICGGADENTVISCNAQVREGHEVWLIYGAHSSPKMLAELTPQVRTICVPSLRREIAPAADARALLELSRLARSIRPDVVHTHTSKAGTLGRLAGRLAGAPIVIHGVHILPFQNVSRASGLVYVGIERALARLTHAFINVSEGMRDGNLAARVGEPSQHHVVYSGMDCDRFRHAKPFTRRELSELLEDDAFNGDGNAPKIVLYAAAFEPRKRHLELLDAFAKVVQEVPSARLLLLGEGQGRVRAEAKVASLGLDGRVHLLGHRSDIERWIATADLCVLSSEREGLPRVAVQYVMAGKPVVATALPGLERVIRHGASGYLVPLADVGQMSPHMIELLKDDVRRHRFAGQAREVDLNDWSAERMTRAIEAIYANALQARGAPARARA